MCTAAFEGHQTSLCCLFGGQGPLQQGLEDDRVGEYDHLALQGSIDMVMGLDASGCQVEMSPQAGTDQDQGA